MSAEIVVGDCVERMAAMGEASVDAIVTDPPYGLEFMGKEWDRLGDGFRRAGNLADVGRDDAFGRASRTSPEYRAGRVAQGWHEAWAREALRVLKPGGHLLAFGGTRTFHRLTCAVEDAGFEIRDCLSWLYGSGFPKSRNLDGAWQGWGTALKPAWEPIVVARKPLSGTVAANVLAHGTGGLNVDGCRIDASGGRPARESDPKESANGAVYAGRQQAGSGFDGGSRAVGETTVGRWPANVVLGHTEGCTDGECSPDCPVRILDEQSGSVGGSWGVASRGTRSDMGWGMGEQQIDPSYHDAGGASRFFYTAKASQAERNAGLAGFAARAASSMPGRRDADDASWNTGNDVTDRFVTTKRNVHPTVKPIDLMRWLVRLVTPPGGTVLDPFAGSGTTGCAAVLEGFEFVGIEREPEYARIAEARIAFWREHPTGLPIEKALAADSERQKVAATGQGSMFDTAPVS